MLNYKNQLMAEIYRNERLNEAKEDRLIRQSISMSVKFNQFRSALIIWFGKQLVCWGLSLQKKQDSLNRSAWKYSFPYER